MTATLDRADQVTITEPGVYELSDADYHRDPVPGGSLSSTGARKLLAPSCPAKYRHWADNPQPPNATFDHGHAAHKLVLGAGPELREIPEEILASNGAASTKLAKEFIADARADGAIPLKPEDYQQVQAMADALRTHPVASALLHPDSGKAEQSLFWQDTVTGVICRARIDWLRRDIPGQRMYLVDYKTTVSAAPDQLIKTVYTYGYHLQADFYIDAVLSLGLTQSQPAFLFVFQEKTAPYLVTVTELTADSLMWGSVLNAKAKDLYAECNRTGHWPGYADDIVATPLPIWAERDYDAARERGEYTLTTDKKD